MLQTIWDGEQLQRRILPSSLCGAAEPEGLHFTRGRGRLSLFKILTAGALLRSLCNAPPYQMEIGRDSRHFLEVPPKLPEHEWLCRLFAQRHWEPGPGLS